MDHSSAPLWHFSCSYILISSNILLTCTTRIQTYITEYIRNKNVIQMPEIQNEIFQLLVTAILMANVCYCANEDES